MNPAKKVLLSTLVAVAGWLSIVSAHAVPVLSISPTASNVAVNGTFKANLRISGLDSVGEIVSGFDLDVFFDPAILTATALIIDLAPWGSVTTLDLNFVAPGHVSFNLTAGLSDAQLDPLQGDSVLLSSINFRGAADGFSTITYGVNVDSERKVLGRGGLNLSHDTQSICVTVGSGVCAVTAVPEPATFQLALMGLTVGAVVMRRRRTLRPMP